MPLNFGRLLRRKPKVLTQVKVAEISAVDHPACPGAKIVLRKRGDRAALKAKLDQATACLAKSVKSIIAGDSVTDKKAMLAGSFGQYLDHVNKLTKRKTSLADIAKLHEIFDARHKNLDVAISPADDDEGFDTDADDDDGGSTPHFLAGTDEGLEATEPSEQLERAESAMRGAKMKSHSELASDVVKKYGIVRFCKSVEQGDVRVSEHELTKLIDEQAKRENTSL
jgi:hypothetical protein